MLLESPLPEELLAVLPRAGITWKKGVRPKP